MTLVEYARLVVGRFGRKRRHEIAARRVDSFPKLAQKRRVARSQCPPQILKVHIHARKALFPHYADRVLNQSPARRVIAKHCARPLGRKASLLCERRQMQKRFRAKFLRQRQKPLVVRLHQLACFRKPIRKRNKRIGVGKNPAQRPFVRPRVRISQKRRFFRWTVFDARHQHLPRIQPLLRG